MNRLGFCQRSKYLKNRFHEVPNHTLVNSGRLRKAEKENKEQPNLNSRIHQDCPSTTAHEKSKNNFSSFELDLTQKVANFGRSFPTKKISKIESKLNIRTLHWLAPLTGIIQMPHTDFFFAKIKPISQEL